MSGCSEVLVESFIVKAEYWSIAFTAFGVRVGLPGKTSRLVSMTSAATPDATAADMLVPVRARYFVPTRSVGLLSTSVLSDAAGAIILWPGARMSGFA